MSQSKYEAGFRVIILGQEIPNLHDPYTVLLYCMIIGNSLEIDLFVFRFSENYEWRTV